MIKIETNKQEFVRGKEHLYRRVLREAARIQTSPDSFEFIYTDVVDGYKMIGNAVPVKFAEVIARQIKRDIDEYIASSAQMIDITCCLAQTSPFSFHFLDVCLV